MNMKNTLLPIGALFAIGIAGNSILHADEVADVSAAESHAEQSSTEIKIVALTDPEIAAAEDEEPDCE